ncbi:MAG: hypothetical protein JW795_17940 [Chitinivibrionales bacterium]|nr:hypothetical protein [Chitinivibrionales bacterium]
MGWGFYGGFPPYVSKAEKIRRAEKVKAALLKKKGVVLEPIMLEGSTIARTWWGEAWTDNLERYADFAYRLDRGRSYVRSGSVIDLKIRPNQIHSLVMGSEPRPYTVKIVIESLQAKCKKALIEQSRTSLDSLQSLLSGAFPEELQDSFFKQGTGLFPSPKEIKLSCSCPDIASMCKHVAAAMYGVAARLDQKPELFFLLRGIEMNEFIGDMVRKESKKMVARAKTKSSRTIEVQRDELSAMFGIAMEETKPAKECDITVFDIQRKPRRTPKGKKNNTASKKTHSPLFVSDGAVSDTIQALGVKKNRQMSVEKPAQKNRKTPGRKPKLTSKAVVPVKKAAPQRKKKERTLAKKRK